MALLAPEGLCVVEPGFVLVVERSGGSGFRVQSVGCRFQGSGFRFQGSGFRVQGSGFRVLNKTAKARFWPWREPLFRQNYLFENFFSRPFLARQRPSPCLCLFR